MKTFSLELGKQLCKEYIEERMKQMTESEKICTKSLLERKYNMTFEIINYQYIKKSQMIKIQEKKIQHVDFVKE